MKRRYPFGGKKASDQVTLAAIPASEIVVTGAGSAFSAGADLKMMRAMAGADPERNQRDALDIGELFHKVASFPRPVVARVNGPAIGGGVGLMAACDIVIATDSAFLAFSEVRMGIVPAIISPPGANAHV